MRQLHPVSLKEKFVASGLYILAEKSQPAQLTEEWSIHQLPDHSEIVRVDRIVASDIILLLEGYRTPAGLIERFDAYLYAFGASLSHQIRATYTRLGDELYITRTLNRETSQETVLSVSSDTLICPPALVFMGMAIKTVAEGSRAVVTAVVEDCDAAYALTALQNSLTVTPAATTYKQVAGRNLEINGYRIQGHGYDAQNHLLWVDQQHILTGLEYQSTEVGYLAQYSRRLEPGQHA